MGLAPKNHVMRILSENLIDIKADGTFRLQMDYFDWHRVFG